MTRINATQFEATYTPSASAHDGTVTASILNGADLFGNTIVSMTTGNKISLNVDTPTADITLSDSSLDVGQVLTVRATYSKTMNTSTTPTVSMIGENTHTVEPMTWIDSDTAETTFTIASGEGPIRVTVGGSPTDIVGRPCDTETAEGAINQNSGSYLGPVAGVGTAATATALVGYYVYRRKRVDSNHPNALP
jgi:hypothetical protein